jgi:hypothetical protein
LAQGAVFCPSTDISLISFYNRTIPTHRFTERPSRAIHGFPDTMAQKPGTFQGEAKSPVELVAADPLLAGRDQVHCLQPDVSRNVAGLHDGLDFNGKRFPARVAFPQTGASSFAAQSADTLASCGAKRANRAIRPNPRLNPRKGSFFVLEMGGVEDLGGHEVCSYGQEATRERVVWQV